MVRKKTYIRLIPYDAKRKPKMEWDMRGIFAVTACVASLNFAPVFALDYDSGAVAQPSNPYELVGIGRLFSNDKFGDNDDRWRTGSYSLSFAFSNEGDNDYGSGPLDLVEFRFRSEIIAPRHLKRAGSDDRIYVGQLSFGAHTHYQVERYEVSLGADMIFTGPQTGMSDFHQKTHEAFSAPSLGDSVIDNQLGNHIFPTLTAEIGKEYQLSRTAPVTMRPFAEAIAGVESLARVGVDFNYGVAGRDIAYSRDSTTGQRIPLGYGDNLGVTWSAGVDYANVIDSAYFPSYFDSELESDRFRARAGVNWHFGDRMAVYYGVTYLSEEYVGQEEGQVLGSFRLNFTY